MMHRLTLAALVCSALMLAPARAEQAEAAPITSANAEVDVADTAQTPEAARSDPENWRAVDPENLLVFDTSKGRILIEILDAAAPAHGARFRALARSGDLDGTAFHRVIDDFMAQGGDILAAHGRESDLPDLEGEFTFRRKPAEMPFDVIGVPDSATEGYFSGFPVQTQSAFLAELSADGLVESWIAHCPGTVSTARTDDPNSANSQFFLMRYTADHLDRRYTGWGRVVAGQDVVMALRVGEPPRDPDILVSARVAADLPESGRPEVWVQRTDGPAFAAVLEAAQVTLREAPYGENTVCALPPVPSVVDG